MRSFRNILVVVEEESQHAAAYAEAVGLARENDARLTFLDIAVASPGEFARLLSLLPGVAAEGPGAELVRYHAERAEAFAAAARAEGIEAEAAVEDGTPFIAVIGRVLAAGHDLVLKGLYTGASGLPGLTRGPDLHLLRKCPCPVWIVRDEPGTGPRRILAAVDPDTTPDDETRNALNRRVLDLAFSLAERDGATVDVVGAWRVLEENVLRTGRVHLPAEEVDTIVERERQASLARLEALIAAYRGRPVTCNILHLKGAPGDVIPEHVASAGIDTIVMGTVGRTCIAGLLIGNTAETILGRTSCAILAIKPPGFVSPVAAAG